MSEPNPDYTPAPYQVSFGYLVRAPRRRVKPSKLKRRLRYYRRKRSRFISELKILPLPPGKSFSIPVLYRRVHYRVPPSP